MPNARSGGSPTSSNAPTTTWQTHQWAQGEERLPKPPSEYYRQSVYSCFFKDAVGVELIDKVGIDQVMFETDYPHQDGTFPDTKKVAEALFSHLPQAQVNKIARENAIRLFDLDF